jgi:hypothetical protein
MKTYNFNDPMGFLEINNNPTGSLGIDINPILEAKSKQAEEEEKNRKRAESFSKLRNFAESLQAMNAGQSGNFGAQAQFLNNIDARRAKEIARAKEEKQKRDEEKLIASLPPEAQRIYELFGKQAAYNYMYNKPKGSERRIVLQNGVQYYADDQTPVLPNAPGKIKTTKQKYDDLAAKIKIEIATNGRNSPNLTTSELDFYDDYIKTGSINYLNKSIANLISGNTSGQNNSTKNYTVTNNSYGSMSANEIINQAMQLNPGATREGVIKNLIANKIISE